MSRLFIIATILLMSGCALTRADIKYYAPAPDLRPQSGVILTGTRIDKPFPYADHTTYIFSVDGEPVDRGESTFSTPVLISPGSHLIGVAWVANEVGGKAYIKLSANPGDKILLKQYANKSIPNDVVQLGFENKATGSPMGESSYVKLERLTSTVYMPVFIPKK